MDNARKRDLTREYKERKQRQGIFAVRCEATGEQWIAASRNLDQQKNSVWFQLRMNGHPNKELQALWNKLGEDAFTFEELEEVADDNALLVPALLKDRAAALLTETGAKPLIG